MLVEYCALILVVQLILLVAFGFWVKFSIERIDKKMDRAIKGFMKFIRREGI